MIKICACYCGSSDSLVRNFLKSVNYEHWLDIPIERGKDKSLSLLNQIPPSAEKEMLKGFLSNASKWAVIIGYDDESVKWSDIAHNWPKSKIEAEALVHYYE